MAKALTYTPETFWARVDKSGDCWLWRGGRDTAGYGSWKHRDRPVKAHRYAYMLTYGPIPLGMYVCHRCDTPSCVRPDHLFLGTPSDNTRDMIRKGRHGGSVNWHPW